MDWTFKPIGFVRSPFHASAGTPIQPRFAGDAAGEIVLDEAFVPCLKDLDRFGRIWAIYLFDRSPGWKPLVRPFRDTVERGLYATRAPARPNPVGISCLRLRGITGHVLHVSEIDILDGTPVLDVKPYVPEYDCYPESQAGWLDDAPPPMMADGRFDPSGRNGGGG